MTKIISKDTQTPALEEHGNGRRCPLSHEPNAETIAALNENIEHLKTYTSARAMIADILNEDDDRELQIPHQTCGIF